MRASDWPTLVALRGVPRHLRASVLGDVLEQNCGVREILAIALPFQVEPYRGAVDRRSALMRLLAAAGTLWIVPLAGHSLLAPAAVFDDAFSRGVLWVWSAPTVLAAPDAVQGTFAAWMMPAAAWRACQNRHASSDSADQA